MKFRYILLAAILIIATSTANAADRYSLDFKLSKGDKNIERGKLIISKTPSSWRRGLKRTYLKLRCVEQQSGKIQKSLSIEDFFTGLDIFHQLHKNNIILKVVHTDVQSRFTEIHALKDNECKDMAPIIKKTVQKYNFQVTNNIKQTEPFGENMSFQVNLKDIAVFN